MQKGRVVSNEGEVTFPPGESLVTIFWVLPPLKDAY